MTAETYIDWAISLLLGLVIGNSFANGNKFATAVTMLIIVLNFINHSLVIK